MKQPERKLIFVMHYIEGTMKLFWALNKYKMKFAFVFCSLAGFGVVFLLFLIGYARGWDMPDVSERNWIFLGAGLGFPVFILAVAYLEWIGKFRKGKRIFAAPPFNELESIGFFLGLKNRESKWQFTEIVMAAEIDGYSLVCETDKERRNAFSMTIYLRPQQFDNQKLAALTRKFAACKIEFNNFVARKWYNFRKPTVTSIDEVAKEIQELTRLLRDEGYEGR